MRIRPVVDVDDVDLADNERLSDWTSPQQLELERRACELEQEAHQEEMLMRFLPDASLKKLHGGLAYSLREEAALLRLEWYTRPHLIH
jgi:hypothetical protein